MRFPNPFRRSAPPAPEAAPPARIEPPVETTIPKPAARKFMASRPDRLAAGFHAFGGQSTRQEIRQDLRGLVAHARHGARNIDYVRGFELLVRRNVVGPNGIRMRARAKLTDGGLDRDRNAAIESAWEEWGRRGACTICGRLSWWNVERIAATSLAREGNFLARVWTGPSRGPFGFQLEILPLDVLDLDLVQTLKGGAYIDGGIEFSAAGRPRALIVYDSPPGEHHLGRSPTKKRVPVEEIIHVFDPTEPAQSLGVPASHTALRRLNMVGKYEESALAAAHFGAAAMAFVKSDPESDGPPAGEEESKSSILPEEIEAGMVAQLPPGADIATWSPNYPDGELPGFTKHMLRGGAAGLGVAYSSLASDLEGANFSSLRAGLGEEREEWRGQQRTLSEGLHAETFRRWLPFAVASGRLNIRPAEIESLAGAVTWQGRGWPSVNPKDDAAAAEADLRNRLRAPSDIATDRGHDFHDIAERIAADMETLRAAGVAPPQAMSAAAPGSPAPAEPDPPPSDANGVAPGDS